MRQSVLVIAMLATGLLLLPDAVGTGSSAAAQNTDEQNDCGFRPTFRSRSGNRISIFGGGVAGDGEIVKKPEPPTITAAAEENASIQTPKSALAAARRC